MKEMIPEALQAKMRPLRVLILDVDGVLTNGEIIIDDAGRETKQFNVRDGHGLRMLMRYGMEVVFLTGRTSQVVKHRALDLGINEVYQGVRNKLEVFEEMLRKKNIVPAATAFVGDDLVDVPVLRRVGFSATVADAAADLKNVVDYITEQKGGCGAVREICELILKAKGAWPEVAARYEL